MIDSHKIDYSKLDTLNVSRETFLELDEFKEMILDENKKINEEMDLSEEVEFNDDDDDLDEELESLQKDDCMDLGMDMLMSAPISN